MKYSDKILISKTDTEYPGGPKFLDLVKRGTLQPPVTQLDTTGYQVFALDVFCYTRRKLELGDTRAFILINTTRPLFESKVKLYLVNGFIGRQPAQYIEVLAEPDNEMSFYENQWEHDLKWFLTGYAFSAQLYETMLSYSKVNPVTRQVDLFGKPLESAVDRIRYVDDVSDLLRWIGQASTLAGSRFGFQQRNKHYGPKLEAAAARWKITHSSPSSLWGTLDEEKKLFKVDDPYTFHAYLFNEFTRTIDQLKGCADDLVDNPDIYAIASAIHLRLDASSQKLMGQYYTTAWTRNKLIAYREQLIQTGGVGSLDLWAFLPNFNV